MAGPLILKSVYRLYDAALCERWLENPDFQHFCGEAAFRPELPLDRSSLSKWRRRLTGAPLETLLQVGLDAAEPTRALAAEDARTAREGLVGRDRAREEQGLREA